MDRTSKQGEAFYIVDEKLVNRQPKTSCMSTLLRSFAILCLLFTTFLLFRVERHQREVSVQRHLSLIRPSIYRETGEQWVDGDTETNVDADYDGTEDTTETKPRAVWGEWSRWSRCSRRKYCQEGSQYRKRKCASLDEDEYCTGVSMESRDCPAGSCMYNYDRSPSLADESQAAETSFIGQECNATTKYYAQGKLAEHIPRAVFDLFPAAKKLMRSGFFAVQVIPKVLNKEDRIIKVCFEPFGRWSLAAVRKTFHLNRSTKASLKNMRSNNLVGLAIGLKPDGSLYGVLVATGTPGAMYSAVYYRRFRGRSFQEDYLTF